MDIYSDNLSCLVAHVLVLKKKEKTSTLDWQLSSMQMSNLWAKIEFLSSIYHPLSLHYRGFFARLSRPPLLLSLALSSKLDTDVDSLCHPLGGSPSLSLSLLSLLSLSLSLSLSSLSLPLSLSPSSIAWRTRVPADAFLFQSTPPSSPLSSLSLFHSLSPCLTLSISPALHTHSIVNKAGEQGSRGIKVHRRGE